MKYSLTFLDWLFPSRTYLYSQSREGSFEQIDGVKTPYLITENTSSLLPKSLNSSLSNLIHIQLMGNPASSPNLKK